MTVSESDYDQWAWLYDKTLGPDYSDQKMGFLDRVLLSKLSPGAQVLDLCCGTGQMIVPLLARGYQVTGLDLSKDMLAYAEGNAPGARFVQSDARDFTFDHQFSGVLCASASLNHMSGEADLADVFASVNRALEPGGTFVFDINHPAQMAQHWRNQPAAGEIADTYAWLITPRYDAATATGAFRVDMYLRPESQKTTLLRRLTDRALRNRFLWRQRLRALANFDQSHPEWDHKSNDYHVHGHDLDMVKRALIGAGFEPHLQNFDGQPEVTDRQAAFFVCRKITEVTQSREAAE